MNLFSTYRKAKIWSYLLKPPKQTTAKREASYIIAGIILFMLFVSFVENM